MSDQPIVTIENGSLKGTVKTDFFGKPYYSFQGIPYAKPPIGDLRFKAPQPSEQWSGVKDATKEGNSCYSKHMIYRTFSGSEDCLFLNVYTPKLPSNDKVLKPVMFWVHGGGFTMGSGDTEFYGAGYLVNQDVVLVTINYRLGLLGFLSFDDASLEIPGNAGLKDQVMALKWVNKNISQFGGDPNNVTIFGESAGGSSVHYLILSQMTKGLFHNAIIQSGVVSSQWARGQRTAPAIASVLGLENATEKEVYEHLKEMSVQNLLELQEKIPDKFEASWCRFVGPVVENKNAVSPFLTEEPLDVIRSGNYNHVPILIGFTSREGMLASADSKREHGEVKFISDFQKNIPHDLKVSENSDLSKSLGEKIKSFYFGSEEPCLNNINQYYLLQGDVLFVYSIYSTVNQHVLTSKKPIYLYRISLDTKLNMFKQMLNITEPGTCHGDDITYLFTNVMTKSLIPNSTEELSLKRFVKLWTTFAKTGNPNPKNDDNLINVTWKPVETKKLCYLEMGEELTVGLNPEQERMRFWDQIYSSILT